MNDAQSPPEVAVAHSAVRSRCAIALIVLATAVAGLLLAAPLVPFEKVRGWVDRYSGDGSADPYTPSLHRRLQIASVVTGGALIGLAWLLARRGSQIRSHWSGLVRNEQSELTGQLRRELAATWPLLVAVTLLSLGLRLEYLWQPMRYDEAQSFLDDSSQPLFVTVSKYDLPNNHVFHSVLVNLATRLFGNGEAAIRLVAFIAGVAIPPVAAFLCWIASRSRLGMVLCGITLSAASILIEYSTNARGYTLVCLLTLIGWCLAVSLQESRSRIAAWALIGCGALGLWAIPTMLYPLAMIWAWLALASSHESPWQCIRRRWRCLFGIVAGTVLLAVLLYSPVLLVSGPRALVGNGYVVALPFDQFVSRIPVATSDLWQLLTRDFPAIGVAILCAGLVLFITEGPHAVRQRRRYALGSLFACAFVVMVQRVLPPARVGLFLAPLISVASCAGLGMFLRRQRLPSRVLAAVIVVATCGVAPVAIQHRERSILRSQEGGAVPDAERLAEFLKASVRDREPIIAMCPVSAPLKYYAQRKQFDMRHFDWPGSANTRGDIAILVNALDPPQTGEHVLESLNLQDQYRFEDFSPLTKYPSAAVWRLDPRPGAPLNSASGSSPTRPSR